MTNDWKITWNKKGGGGNNSLHWYNVCPPKVSLLWCSGGGLCHHMIPRAILAIAYANGRASHDRQVKGDDPDKNGYPGPPGWGSGMRLTTPPHKKNSVTKPQWNEAGRIPWQWHEAIHKGLPKQRLWTNPAGQQGHGQLKSRWIDRVEEDARKLGCRNWLADAQDRCHWWHLLEEAKAHPGL